jgi:crossover junction endodeoxyribonuclease RusA
VNTYWRSVPLRGRVRVLISEEGQRYAREVALRCLEQKAPRDVSGRLAVRLYVEPPDTRIRDIDNLPKAILDALTKAKVWMDDSQVDALHVVRGPKFRGGRIIATITPPGLPIELGGTE